MPAKNYNKILTELFRTYNPAKVAEVDSLLKKFAGREEELIAKIHQKYGGQKRRRRRLLILFGIGLLVAFTATWWWVNGPPDATPEAGMTATVPRTNEAPPAEPDLETAGIELPPSEPPLEYGVQIGLFSTAHNDQILVRLGDRQVDLNVLPAGEGRFMYVMGNDQELAPARERCEALRADGFPDAFVVALRKGKRVAIRPEE
ncbi:MAG: hypothetical protein AAF998_19700 [Bacteroidota bacterium]